MSNVILALSIVLVVTIGCVSLYMRHTHLQHMPNCYAVHGEC